MDRGAPVALTSTVLPGCEGWSHVAGSRVGVLVVHGFTGTPASVRGVAEVMAGSGYDVELPRLPGHGTTVDDMLLTRWIDWAGAVADAKARLSARVDAIVVVGQSMGGTLVLAAALDDPGVSGLICVNPLTRTRDADTMEMLDDLLDDGINVVPGGDSDIADPQSSDIAYSGTPLAPLRSLLLDGVSPITDRFGELGMPMRLFTSHNDHVVDPGDSTHLAATYGGPVEHTWLERSFHVATRDYDRGLIEAESVAFVARVCA
jgi:carboxylesterase